MRKTTLWFNPPSTPEYYNPRITRDGNNVSMRKKRKSNINQAKRFPQYEIDANRLGAYLGPGAYNQSHFSILSKMKKSQKSFFFYRQRDVLNNTKSFKDYSSSVPNIFRTN